MKLVVHVTIEPDTGETGTVTTVDVATVHRDALTGDTLGLQVVEAKQVLAGVQEVMVTEQAARAVAAVESCGSCTRRHRHKDSREIQVRSLFGTVRLLSPRWWSCPCRDGGPRTFSPLAQLLPDRTTPELVFVETELAGLMSYRLAGRVLERLLPIGRRLHPSEPRRRVRSVADRLDDELGPEQSCFIDRPCRSMTLPIPDLPLVVTVDGGYVHSTEQTSRRDGWFQAIVGTVTHPDGGRSKMSPIEFETLHAAQPHDNEPAA